MLENLYDILKVPQEASIEQIKNAYKNLAKEYHPDKNPGSEWHEEQFKKINRAYQILSDSSKRKHYDQQLEYNQFKQEYRSAGTNRNTDSNQPRKRQKYRAATVKPKTADYKLYTIVGSFFLTVSIGGFLLYHFMNKYAASEAMKKADNLFEQKRYKESYLMYSEALSFKEDIPEAYEKRAEAGIIAINNYQGAVSDYTLALRYASTSRAELFLKRAKANLKIKEYKAGIDDLDSAYKKKPELDSIYFFKGEAYYIQDKFEEAIVEYSTFLKKDSTSMEAILKKGFCYFKNQNFLASLKEYNKYISFVPEDGEVYYYRAFAYFALEEKNQGCRDLHYSRLLGFNEAISAIESYCR